MVENLFGLSSAAEIHPANIVFRPSGDSVFKQDIQTGLSSIRPPQPLLMQIMGSLPNPGNKEKITHRFAQGGTLVSEFKPRDAIPTEDANYIERLTNYKYYSIAEGFHSLWNVDTLAQRQAEMAMRMFAMTAETGTSFFLKAIQEPMEQRLTSGLQGSEPGNVSEMRTAAQDGWVEWTKPLADPWDTDRYERFFENMGEAESMVGNLPPGVNPVNVAIVERGWWAHYLKLIRNRPDYANIKLVTELTTPLTTQLGNVKPPIHYRAVFSDMTWDIIVMRRRTALGQPSLLHDFIKQDPNVSANWLIPRAFGAVAGSWLPSWNPRIPFQMVTFDQQKRPMDHAVWSVYETAGLRIPGEDCYATTWESVPKTIFAASLKYNFYLANTPYVSSDEKKQFYADYVGRTLEGKETMRRHMEHAVHISEGKKVLDDLVCADMSKVLPGIGKVTEVVRTP